MSIETATTIARLVHEHGGRALVVGGWVRDRLLELHGLDGPSPVRSSTVGPSKDVDVEVYGLPAARLKALLATLGPVNTVGESFTVYKVLDVDVSLPRRESKIGRGHRAFDVSGEPDMRPEEAARRRDFTVNAIAWDPLTDTWIDPFDGRRDLLERRVLRAVDPRTFGDDSLRVLRGIQFAARFDLEMDPGTKAICRRIPLDDLPAERVWGEIDKLLLLSERPSVGLRTRARARSDRPALPRVEGARRVPTGAGVAPGGGRLGAHAAGHRRSAPPNRRPRPPETDHGDARRRLSRPREAAHDGVRRRADPVHRPRAGRCRANGRAARPVERADDRRLRRRTPGDRDRGAPLETARVLQIGDARRRWRIPSACGKGGPGAARARGDVGLSWEDRAHSTARPSTAFSSARAPSASNIGRRRPL